MFGPTDDGREVSDRVGEGVEGGEKNAFSSANRTCLMPGMLVYVDSCEEQIPMAENVGNELDQPSGFICRSGQDNASPPRREK